MIYRLSIPILPNPSQSFPTVNFSPLSGQANMNKLPIRQQAAIAK